MQRGPLVALALLASLQRFSRSTDISRFQRDILDNRRVGAKNRPLADGTLGDHAGAYSEHRTLLNGDIARKMASGGNVRKVLDNAIMINGT